MKILVTGASGFIGNYIITALLDRGINVVATSTDEKKIKNSSWYHQVDYVPFTIGESGNKNLISYFHNPDQCIHLAWDGLSNFKDEKHTDEYFRKQYDFLSCLVQEGISKITVTGTCLEYGLREGELNEEMKVNPIIAYGIGKDKLRIALERLQKDNTFQLDWIRLFYMYGEGQSSKSILAQLEKHIKEKEAIFNMSEGEQIRDYLPISEIAEIIVKLAATKKGNGIVNCCSGKPLKIRALVENYLKANQATIELNLGYYPYPDYEPFQFWGSTSKLNKIINE